MKMIYSLFIISILFFVSCSCKSVAKNTWQIAYSRIDYFFGSGEIKIGTDSCYYLNQGGINKNPPIFKWKSTTEKLDKLYKQIEKFELQECSQIMASVTEDPFETLEFVQNGKVIFAIQKHQQTVEGVKKFEEVLSILKSFSVSENNGWKY